MDSCWLCVCCVSVWVYVGMCVCALMKYSYFYSHFNILLVCFTLLFWMELTFCICDLERGKWSQPHVTDEAQRGCESLLGRKRVLELDVLMTKRRGKQKNSVAPPFGVLTGLFFCGTWMAPQLYFSLEACVRWEWLGWQMLQMFFYIFFFSKLPLFTFIHFVSLCLCWVCQTANFTLGIRLKNRYALKLLECSVWF